jgi:hypothetical protein
MKPALALHRSLTFWAGILLVAFTCWAWWDASRNQVGCYGRKGALISEARGITLVSRNARDDFHFWRHRFPYTPGHSPREFFPSPFFLRHEREPDPDKLMDPGMTFRALKQLTADSGGPGTWVLYLPYWLILIPLILTWLALLLYRARRLARARLPVSA